MKDYLVKAIAYNNQVRAYAAITTEAVGEAKRRHHTLPTASVALGRSMTAGVILGAMLQGEEKISIKINGGGPIGTILVDANTKGEVRGYVTNPQTHFDLNDQGKLRCKKSSWNRWNAYRIKGYRLTTALCWICSACIR